MYQSSSLNPKNVSWLARSDTDGTLTASVIVRPIIYGLMTFVLGRGGVVLQKDLGPDTARVAQDLTLYDPDKSWLAGAAPEGQAGGGAARTDGVERGAAQTPDATRLYQGVEKVMLSKLP
jgi:Protein of unknown function (DUF2950)